MDKLNELGNMAVLPVEKTTLFRLCVNSLVNAIFAQNNTPVFSSEWVKIPVSSDVYNYVVSCGNVKLIANNWQDKIELVSGGVVYTITHEIQAIEILHKNGVK